MDPDGWSQEVSDMWNNVLVMGIFLALCVGFVKHTDQSLLAGKPNAPQKAGYAQPRQQGGGNGYGVVTLFAAQHGHFFADATVDGTHVDFLVDTGASMISLTELDAQRIGFRLNELDYRYKANTANGVVPVAVVKLDQVDIGGITVYDVDASIHRGGGLDQSLLGMSLLKKLSSFRVDGSRLVMHQ